MKCKNCNNEEINKKRNICGSCMAKDYRKNNPEKVKAYSYMRADRDKEKQKEYNKRYRAANLEKIKKYNLNGKRKIDNVIRCRTKDRYPLKGNVCMFCKIDAEERHHTTTPMIEDKFVFICRSCHKKVHRGILDVLDKENVQ